MYQVFESHAPNLPKPCIGGIIPASRLEKRGFVSLPEHATRKRLIDKALKRAGWSPIIPFDTTPPRHLVAFEEYLMPNGPADYALFHNRQPLAIFG